MLNGGGDKVVNFWVVDFCVDGSDVGVALGSAERNDPRKVPFAVNEALKGPTRVTVARA